MSPTIEIVAGLDTKHWSIRNTDNRQIYAHSEQYATRWSRNRAAKRLAKLTGWEIVRS